VVAEPALRIATPDDAAAVDALMKQSVAVLFPRFYDERQSASAVRYVSQVDPMLLDDGTYFVLESGGEIVGCGGWSRRATLFGHNHTAGRDARLLDPGCEAARIRAMYTAPAFVRRGVGRKILELCEAAARKEGFARAELGATAGGEPLYRACGYQEIERMEVPTQGGVTVPITRMGKAL